MKIAPLLYEIKKHPEFVPVFVHTGQHYDNEMSDLFFKHLGIPEPNINLEVGSASHACQTAKIMERFEKVCVDQKPDAVLVVGDVNSTAACTLVASKLDIKTIHYEAGLRSGDKSMPEEINRLVTDSITDLFFTTSKDADENLIKEGHDKKKIYMCGNLMIDTLVKNLKKSGTVKMQFETLFSQKIKMGEDFMSGEYGVMTIHRPSNVDKKENLGNLMKIWLKISEKIPLIFPVHPRTWKNILNFSLDKVIRTSSLLFLIEPIGYLQFLNLMKNSKFVITDSGGIQEETTYLNIPCLTIRPNTERPITVWEGSNKLVTPDEVPEEVDLILKGKGKKGMVPKYWDGKSANRIVKIFLKELKSQKVGGKKVEF